MYMDNKKELIAVGTTSKFWCFIFKYPFYAMMLLLLFWCSSVFLYGEDITLSMRGGGVLFVFFLFLYFVIYVLFYKWCYQVVIDKRNNSIICYRFCNRAAQTFKLDGLKVVIGSYCHIVVGGSDFILHENYAQNLLSALPKNTIVEYKEASGKSKRKI